jgi:uncharacterized membrane protein
MATDAGLLAEVPLFSRLDDKERDDLAQKLHIENFTAGHVVFRHGDPGESLYIVRSGQVEAFVQNQTGERIVLDIMGPGEFFGEISLLDEGPRSASILATQDVEALVVHRSDLNEFLRRRPDAALDLLGAAGKRLRASSELLRRTASRNANEEIEEHSTRAGRIADWIAAFSGSITFLLLHCVLFFIWIILNVGLFKFGDFDPYPFGLLTMSVSLEAIILSVFVLLSQNRQAASDRVRADVEYEVNLKAELEILHLHEKVDHFHVEVLKRLANLERTSAAAK